MNRVAFVISRSCLLLIAGLIVTLSSPASDPSLIAQTHPAATSDRSSQREADFKSLYESHQWFKLREAVHAADAPAFYRGVAAVAFHDVQQAEEVLLSAIKAAPQSEQALEAQSWLIYLYQRTGRYRQAVSQIDAMTKTRPKRADLKNARALFAAFGQYPEQVVASRRPSSVRYRMKGGNLFIPISVNHRPLTCVVDTGAVFSLLSESEARRLGLSVHDAGGHQTSDAAGLQVGVRIAIADRLEVGHFQLRNVPFMMMRDDQGPFPDLLEGERGAIGLPVLLAFQTMRWGSKGNFEVDFPSASENGLKSNMCFEGVQPFIEAEFRQKTIQALLDTGAGITHALPLFAQEFASFIQKSGQAESQRVTGMGGSVKVNAVTLPELTLRVGGFNAVLHPAQVLLKATTSDSRWCHVWIGMDILNQARRVTLDFKSMRITLE